MTEKPSIEKMSEYLAQLRDNDDDVSEAAVSALVKIGEPAVEPLIEILGSVPRASLALIEIGEPAVEPLIEASGSSDFMKHTGAGVTLWRIGEPAVEPLIAVLKNEKNGEDFRKYGIVVAALGMIEDERAVEPLFKVLEYEFPNFPVEIREEVRKTAAVSLLLLGREVEDKELRENAEREVIATRSLKKNIDRIARRNSKKAPESFEEWEATLPVALQNDEGAGIVEKESPNIIEQLDAGGTRKHAIFEPSNKEQKSEKYTEEYVEFLFYFYNKLYPASFHHLGASLRSGQAPDMLEGLSVPTPIEWESLLNNTTRGVNPPNEFGINERLFFILLHGFVATLQSNIEYKYANPFTGLSMAGYGFGYGADEPGREFFENHKKDIIRITGTDFSYREFAKVVEYYKKKYHTNVDTAIRGSTTMMMDELEFDFRIGMKAGMLNTEMMIESLSVSGFGNIMESFYPLLKEKLEFFSDEEMNCYCNDILYRYSKIGRIKDGTRESDVISAFKNDRIEIYDNIHTTITLKPGGIEMFKSTYEELKDRVEDFTESETEERESGEMKGDKEKEKKKDSNEWIENFIIIRKKKEK